MRHYFTRRAAESLCTRPPRIEGGDVRRCNYCGYQSNPARRTKTNKRKQCVLCSVTSFELNTGIVLMTSNNKLTHSASSYTRSNTCRNWLEINHCSSGFAHSQSGGDSWNVEAMRWLLSVSSMLRSVFSFNYFLCVLLYELHHK